MVGAYAEHKAGLGSFKGGFLSPLLCSLFYKAMVAQSASVRPAVLLPAAGAEQKKTSAHLGAEVISPAAKPDNSGGPHRLR
jgi:hypothetical protein